MRPVQLALLVTANTLILVVVAGLVARGRMRRVWFFAPYLATVFLTSTMIGLWPARFLNWGFWVVKEMAIGLLKLAIALELSYRVFATLPRAGSAARGLLVAVLLATAWAALGAPLSSRDSSEIARVTLSRLGYGTVWLFSVLLVVVAWYRIPLDPIHKAVLLGFVPYLLTLTVGLSMLEAFGWKLHAVSSYGMSAAYVALMAFWAWAAWRPEAVPPADVDVVHRIQPWR